MPPLGSMVMTAATARQAASALATAAIPLAAWKLCLAASALS